MWVSRVFCMLICMSVGCGVAQGARPNVLMISVDDMNDWVGCLGGYEGELVGFEGGSHTPHIDALAKRGVLFTNAHAASPKCGPSRAAIFTGRMASSTGLYDNGHWVRPHLGRGDRGGGDRGGVVTMPEHFRANGYKAMGAGKVFHHTAGFNPPDQWDAFFDQVFDDPWDRPSRVTYPQVKFVGRPKGHPFNGITPVLHEFDWGPIPGKAEGAYGDVMAVDWVIEKIKEAGDEPVFLAAGLFHPHLPWLTPGRYFEGLEVGAMVMPGVVAGDLDDVPKGGKKLAAGSAAQWKAVRAAGKEKEMVQAYLASIAFADAQVGRLMAALDASGLAEETVVVLWSDHGWHFGEKDHLMKSTLWEEATRVPLIVAGPGVAKGACGEAVSLVDLYPTLIELCGLSDRAGLDGESLVGLLKDVNAVRQKPAVVTYGKGNHAVRDERWRYIKYAEGGEELYDHTNDPKEWQNLLAGSDAGKYGEVKAELGKWLPKVEAPTAPGKGAYDFDWKTYTWTVKETGEVLR